jgi:hypothetical protein
MSTVVSYSDEHVLGIWVSTLRRIVGCYRHYVCHDEVGTGCFFETYVTDYNMRRCHNRQSYFYHSDNYRCYPSNFFAV